MPERFGSPSVRMSCAGSLTAFATSSRIAACGSLPLTPARQSSMKRSLSNMAGLLWICEEQSKAIWPGSSPSSDATLLDPLGGHGSPRRVQPVQCDLPHDRFARFDMADQQHSRVFELPFQRVRQDLRGLVVRRIDPFGLREIEAPDDAY